LPHSEEKELLQKFDEFKSSKQVFLSIKGLDEKTLKTIKELEKKLTTIKGVNLKPIQSSAALKQYKRDYTFYIKDFKHKHLENLNINKELETLKAHILNSNFSYFIHVQDPFNLLKNEAKAENFSFKNNHLILKDYGYFSVFNLDSSIDSLQEYETIYDAMHSMTNLHESVQIFSPIFYFVENSRIIKKDVNAIILFSMIVLILLYVIILRNIKLLIHTLMTLTSSVLLALLLTSFIFDTLSIFVIVFGISISAVAIDYMFHHYTHAYYTQKRTFNKEVFLGMFTSIGAFFIISFVPFDLIRQICYFAMISLVFSYFQFAFLYPKIGFSQKLKLNKEKSIFFIKVHPKSIIIFSLLLIFISFFTIKFDLNLKNLDVHNPKLKKTEHFFNEHLNLQHHTLVLIKANSVDALIKNANVLKKAFPEAHIPLALLVDEETFKRKKAFLQKYSFDKLNDMINEKAPSFGFKEDFFKQAYVNTNKKPIYTLEKLQSMNLEVMAYKNFFITYAHLPKEKKGAFQTYDFIQILSLKNMFENNLTSIYNELIWHGLLTLGFIVFMVVLSAKRNHLLAFSYIVFPLSLILSLSFFIDFNLLHLFMLFIFLSISIDFGIYMGSKNINHNTHKAVLYSLLSTFAGFGVLIFSNLAALYSIGMVATMGIVAVTILLIVLKGNNDTYNIK
jgi:hypothetical protein